MNICKLWSYLFLAANSSPHYPFSLISLCKNTSSNQDLQCKFWSEPALLLNKIKERRNWGKLLVANNKKRKRNSGQILIANILL